MYRPTMIRKELLEQKLTESVIGAFFEVYNILGFGFLEHVYVMAMERELRSRGHKVAREMRVPVMYKGEELASQRLDMVVDGKLVVEIKSTYELHKAAERQIYNYLKATDLEVGLLLHFGPEAKFYRKIHKKNPSIKENPDNQFNLQNPDNPSDMDAALRSPLAAVRTR